MSPLSGQSQAATTRHPAHVRIGMRLNGALPWLALPPGVPSQLALDPQLAPLPNVKPWLPGVLNLRGNLVPVFDIGLWHGCAALGRDAHVLVVAPGRAAVAVLCCEAPALLELRAGGSVAADDPLAALSSSWFHGPQGAVYEFDPHDWLRRVGRQVPGARQN